MEIKSFRERDFAYLIIDDLYTSEELKKIWRELEYLTSPNRLWNQSTIGGATDKEGTLLKKNNGMLLDDFFTYNRDFSDILTLNRKLFTPPVLDAFFDTHPYSRLFAYVNNDRTLLSYYENEDYYKPHHDDALFTAVTWLYKEPKRFTGGNFRFHDGDIDIELKSNRLVLFPSWVLHEVEMIKLDDEIESDGFSTYGRYCLSQFIHKR